MDLGSGGFGGGRGIGRLDRLGRVDLVYLGLDLTLEEGLGGDIVTERVQGGTE